MVESKSAIHALPKWQRYAFVIGLIVALPIAFYYKIPMAITAIVGPIFLVHLWTSQKIAFYSRSDRPALFWAGLGLFVFATGVAYWELYKYFFEAGQ